MNLLVHHEVHTAIESEFVSAKLKGFFCFVTRMTIIVGSSERTTRTTGGGRRSVAIGTAQPEKECRIIEVMALL